MKRSFSKKFLILPAAFGITFISSIKAQNSHIQNSFIFVHVIDGFPVDASTKNTYNSTIGGELGFGVGAANTYFIASAGYLSCEAKDSFQNESYVPLKVGVRQYFLRKDLFLTLNAGAGFVNNSLPTKETATPSTIRFAADVGVGTNLKNFEFGIVFDIFNEPKPDGTSGWVEAKLGWNFRLGKK